MHRGAWWTMVHRVTKTQTQLSNLAQPTKWGDHDSTCCRGLLKELTKVTLGGHSVHIAFSFFFQKI